MKATVTFLIVILLFCSCGHGVEKPKNLIEKGKMIDIMYDFSLLEAMRSQLPIVLENNQVNPDKYIYKKYHIDSLQFVKSNQYYASDLKEYKKMYDEVAKRLNAGQPKKPVDPNAPQIQ